MLAALEESDPDLARLLAREERRQAESLCLIPSENYCSPAVLEANGSVLVNKYAEGYPGKRYYEGNEIIDEIERLAQTRALELFGAEHVNVQPYSGSPANLAIFLAFVKPGETVMGLSLPAGGHLTHGWGVSATGIWFNAVHYGVREDTGRVDMDEVRELALEHRPKLLFCGGTAVPRTIDFAAFAAIAKEVDALMVADVSHLAGLIAGGAHPSPVPHADVVMTTTHKTLRGPRGAILMCREQHAKPLDKAVFPGLQGGPHQQQTAAIAVALGEAATPAFGEYAHNVVANAKVLADALTRRGFTLISGGTDNHLILIDVTSKGVSGKEASTALSEAGIVTNANAIPFDPRKPFDPSGVRIGTPAATTRGLGAEHMEEIARWMDEVINAVRTDAREPLARVRGEVGELMEQCPAPGCASSAAVL
ncbi:MAG TPA: serine hydroxymethyltransferase [Solirubrobacteraceae bacterium]|jgi:glycine hydroxymethyltransferase|nr:serine hydroxymethyltransferase [Solirubrobacteraceae bacterium]